MSKIVLQVNYAFTSSVEEHRQLVTPMAEPISAVPGLIWKVWLMNEADKEAGGIYLFESSEAANGFMNSDAVASFVSQPTVTNVSAKMFSPDETLSRVTRGPLAVTETI